MSIPYLCTLLLLIRLILFLCAQTRATSDTADSASARSRIPSFQVRLFRSVVVHASSFWIDPSRAMQTIHPAQFALCFLLYVSALLKQTLLLLPLLRCACVFALVWSLHLLACALVYLFPAYCFPPFFVCEKVSTSECVRPSMSSPRARSTPAI